MRAWFTSFWARWVWERGPKRTDSKEKGYIGITKPMYTHSDGSMVWGTVPGREMTQEELKQWERDKPIGIFSEPSVSPRIVLARNAAVNGPSTASVPTADPVIESQRLTLHGDLERVRDLSSILSRLTGPSAPAILSWQLRELASAASGTLGLLSKENASTFFSLPTKKP